MSHTNNTTNYNLPQFVSSDKPTWLGDVNGAFSAIDAQMKANATAAAGASAAAATKASQTEVNGISSQVGTNTAAITQIQSDLQKIRVYDGVFNTGTLTGNSRHTVNVTLPSAESILAVIPYGFDPSTDWNTLLYFDGATNAGAVSFMIKGASSQYYAIKYKVIYTVA